MSAAGAMIRPVALVGLPGAGKSTIGPLLAHELGLPFVDADRAIEARAGRPIAAIFAEGDEAAFRAVERETLDGLLDAPAVIALGGGAFADAQTRACIRRAALTLRLDVPMATLIARVGDGARRPLLAGDPAGGLIRLAAARAAAHAEADLAVDATAHPRAVARAAAALIAAGPPVERLPVGARPYEVVIGSGLMVGAGARIAAATGARRALIVTDSHVGPLYAPALTTSLAEAGIAAATHLVPAGEATKGWPELSGLVEAMAAARLARADIVVALGGGVVGDLSGFAAAIYMRGMRWVQIPTSLLAQVDSSVGGKTAIDLAAGKNLAGAFHDPALVLADTDTLATLRPRELRSGYAEIAKAALLGDVRFFAWLEAHGAAMLAREPAALRLAIAHAVRLKARIVTADPTEQGARALLNLGHTFGHALEAETGFGDAMTHGEAVALGCALAFRFSAARGRCAAAEAGRVAAHLATAGLPTRLPPGLSADALTERMRGDKKAGSGGAITLILARAIGDAFVARDVPADEIAAFWRSEGAS